MKSRLQCKYEVYNAMRTQQQEVLQNIQWHQENLHHNISIKSGSLEWEESSSFKDK